MLPRQSSDVCTWDPWDRGTEENKRGGESSLNMTCSTETHQMKSMVQEKSDLGCKYL